MCQHYFFSSKAQLQAFYKFLESQDIFLPKIGLYFCWLLQKLCPLLEDGCTLHVFEVFLSKFLRKMLSLLGYCSTCGFPARKLSLPKVRVKAPTISLWTSPCQIIIKKKNSKFFSHIVHFIQIYYLITVLTPSFSSIHWIFSVSFWNSLTSHHNMEIRWGKVLEMFGKCKLTFFILKMDL